MMTFEERFWAKVVKSDGVCWGWTAYRDREGYGVIKNEKRKVEFAHRASWRIHKGATDLQVLHTCDNPACVNPDHLFLGDPTANMADKVKKGRQRGPIGVTNASAKLTEDQVRAIRVRSGEKRRSLALEFGVTPTTISNICLGKGWRHLFT